MLPIIRTYMGTILTLRNNVKLAQTLGACGFAVCLWDTLAYLHIEYGVVWVGSRNSDRYLFDWSTQTSFVYRSDLLYLLL